MINVAALVRVPFQGEQLEAVPEGARLWLSIRRICEALGLALEPQLVKLKAKLWATMTIIVMVADDGRRRSVACIDLDSLPMWLATIDAGRVAPGVRDKLLAYQREAAQVLRNHFFGAKPAAAPGLSADEVRALVREELAAAGSRSPEGHNSRSALPGRWPTQRWPSAGPDSLTVVRSFVEQYQDGGEAVNARALYHAFIRWARMHGSPEYSNHAFGRRMKELALFEALTTSRGRLYVRRPVIVAEGVQ